MTQYKNRFYLPDSKVLTNGEVANVCQENDTPRACARYAQNITTKKENYYIKMHGGHVVNPYDDSYTTRMDSKQVKYKKVPADVFLKYTSYLRTGANYLIREIERSVADA